MMDWKQLISNKRLGQEYRHTERHDDRTEFKRDYDRLIFSAPFRRLQNKTQVFPLPGSIFVHNRLTHSLEVASVGMSLGNDVAQCLIRNKHPELKDTMFEQIGQIVSTACLAHDLGNPPFGHSGEKAIQTFFTEGKGKDIKEIINEHGYDCIVYRNEREDVGNYSIAMFEPNNIKLACDTVDDGGNPIPINERFNTKINDVRY
jgi:dGTPase